MAEENAMAWVERGISPGHRCHILLETNLFFEFHAGVMFVYHHISRTKTSAGRPVRFHMS